MSERKIIQILKQYQESSIKKRGDYLRTFEEKMIYRTTKTENPQTTLKLVRKILNKKAELAT
ncbi:MAG: hypothetical protein PHU56_01575 [Candidatus Pacebacteria bacterium]|nr:hypothetical protein [Candidatus Paceibacterota bacterium]